MNVYKISPMARRTLPSASQTDRYKRRSQLCSMCLLRGGLAPTFYFAEEIRSVHVDGQVKNKRDRDKNGRVLVIAPVLDQSVDDGSFEDDVGGLRELKQ
jgi:hypothetical protein